MCCSSLQCPQATVATSADPAFDRERLSAIGYIRERLQSAGTSPAPPNQRRMIQAGLNAVTPGRRMICSTAKGRVWKSPGSRV